MSISVMSPDQLAIHCPSQNPCRRSLYFDREMTLSFSLGLFSDTLLGFFSIRNGEQLTSSTMISVDTDMVIVLTPFGGKVITKYSSTAVVNSNRHFHSLHISHFVLKVKYATCLMESVSTIYISLKNTWISSFSHVSIHVFLCSLPNKSFPASIRLDNTSFFSFGTYPSF